MADAEDDEDPVVHEIDVFLSKALAQKLYLFQYPVRPANMTYDQTPHLAARAKLKQKKIELEISLDISSDLYCDSRGEQIAQAVNATTKDGEADYYNSMRMNKQTLSSVRATEDTSKFVVGVLREDALHLTPVHGAVQLRPGFDYLDKVDDFSKKIETEKDGDSQDEEEEAKPIMLKFTKSDDKSKQRRMKSFSHQEEVEASEAWIPFQYHQPHSQQAFAEKMLMFCHQIDFESPEFITTSREYLKMLSPAPQNKISHSVAMPDGMLSLTQLQGMDLLDKIKVLMINAKVMQFSQISGLIGARIDDKALLRGITQYASLVQGCWVVKSEILYPKGSKTLVTGMDAEKLWAARDYVLWCFNLKSVISRKDIACIVKVPHDELKDILEQVSRQRARGWEFVLPADVDFLERFTDVVKMQVSLWKRRYLSLMDTFDIPKEPSEEGFHIPGLDLVTCKIAQRQYVPRHLMPKVNDEREPVKQRRRNRSISHEARQDAAHKDKPNRAKVKTEKDIDVKQEKPDDENDDVRMSPDMNNDVDIIETVIDGDINMDNDVTPMMVDSTENEAFVPPPAPTIDDRDDEVPSELYLKELQNFIKNTIKSGCMSLHDIQEILEIRRKEPGSILRCPVSDELLEDTVRKTDAKQILIKWPEDIKIPHSKQTVFYYPTFGHSTDKFRPMLCKLFESNISIRRKDLMTICTEELGSTPTGHSYAKLMEELCERHKNQYYLRGTYRTINPNGL